MKSLPLTCPYCSKPAQIAAIHCSECQAECRGNFASNEFASLPEEDLHFLRVFLQCEGRIKEMESPLGLSYPTIRTRLSALKARILSPDFKPETKKTALEQLANGEIPFEEALKKIKEKK